MWNDEKSRTENYTACSMLKISKKTSGDDFHGLKHILNKWWNSHIKLITSGGYCVVVHRRKEKRHWTLYHWKVSAMTSYTYYVAVDEYFRDRRF